MSGEILNRPLLAVVRIMLELLNVVEQRLDEADGRASTFIVELIKLMASKQGFRAPIEARN